MRLVDARPDKDLAGGTQNTERSEKRSNEGEEVPSGPEKNPRVQKVHGRWKRCKRRMRGKRGSRSVSEAGRPKPGYVAGPRQSEGHNSTGQKELRRRSTRKGETRKDLKVELGGPLCSGEEKSTLSPALQRNVEEGRLSLKKNGCP